MSNKVQTLPDDFSSLLCTFMYENNILSVKKYISRQLSDRVSLLQSKHYLLSIFQSKVIIQTLLLNLLTYLQITVRLLSINNVSSAIYVLYSGENLITGPYLMIQKNLKKNHQQMFEQTLQKLKSVYSLEHNRQISKFQTLDLSLLRTKVNISKITLSSDKHFFKQTNLRINNIKYVCINVL